MHYDTDLQPPQTRRTVRLDPANLAQKVEELEAMALNAAADSAR